MQPSMLQTFHDFDASDALIDVEPLLRPVLCISWFAGLDTKTCWKLAP
jgi:hypothetical protein